MQSVENAECGKYIKEKDIKNICAWIYENGVKEFAPITSSLYLQKTLWGLYDRFSNENAMMHGLEGLLIYR